MICHPRQALAWLACALLAASASPTIAATINHGDFGPDFPAGVTMYQDVQEDSGTDPVPPARYGAPTLSGDTLDFDPSGFVASATDGTSDITDVQLNLDMMVLEFNDVVAGGFTSILISESGDYSLLGGGTGLTSVAAGVSVDIEILEVDGSPIDPISMFASASVTRDLVSDGPVMLAPWSNGLLVEFDPVLAANNIDYEYGVTKAELVFNDQLAAISEPNSIAFIAKKDFRIEPGIDPNPSFEGVIPEPTSVVLMALMLGAGIASKRLGG